MDIQEAIRQAACEKTQEMMCSGEIVLPLNYSEQAAQEVERLRSTKRKLKTLKRWRSAGKILYEQVLVFGDIILTDEDGWYTIFERPPERWSGESISMTVISTACINLFFIFPS